MFLIFLNLIVSINPNHSSEIKLDQINHNPIKVKFTGSILHHLWYLAALTIISYKPLYIRVVDFICDSKMSNLLF